jgi:hypothetical protein
MPVEIVPNRDLHIQDLRIDLSSVSKTLVEINPNELTQMELLNSGVDLSLTEVYIPIFELAVYSDQLAQYLT